LAEPGVGADEQEKSPLKMVSRAITITIRPTIFFKLISFPRIEDRLGLYLSLILLYLYFTAKIKLSRLNQMVSDYFIIKDSQTPRPDLVKPEETPLSMPAGSRVGTG
jgi:hypothetical protein